MPSTELLASGEVGLLADENAQRLCSLFSEAAWECLLTLRDMSLSRGAGTARFKELYAAGLASVSTWNAEVVREEVVRLEARYPEAVTIFQYVYVLLAKEVGDDPQSALTDAFPPLEEVYHIFLRRVCASPDVLAGASFFSEPMIQRRVVFLECFRNAMHDVLRRRTRGRPAAIVNLQPMPAPVLHRTPPSLPAPPSLPGEDEEEPPQRPSVLRAAMDEVVVAQHQDEDDDDRCVSVSRSPCFFDDEDAAATTAAASASKNAE